MRSSRQKTAGQALPCQEQRGAGFKECNAIGGITIWCNTMLLVTNVELSSAIDVCGASYILSCNVGLLSQLRFVAGNQTNRCCLCISVEVATFAALDFTEGAVTRELKQASGSNDQVTLGIARTEGAKAFFVAALEAIAITIQLSWTILL